MKKNKKLQLNDPNFADKLKMIWNEIIEEIEAEEKVNLKDLKVSSDKEKN